MYCGRHITVGDEIYIFASESQGGAGLVAVGTVASRQAVPRRPGVERQTPRINLTVRLTGSARSRLGRAELRAFGNWRYDRAETELNFKLYRLATNKVVGLSADAAAFLRGLFV